MKNFKSRVCWVLILSLILSVPAAAAETSSPDYTDLVEYWAPTIYQDVTTSYDVRADFLTRFDFDGDWSGINNWENTFLYPLTSAVYYSVQETETHYFINYCFFHPRDDAPVSLDRHENDFEGALFVIEKDGSEFGSFLLMETQAHNHFYQYSNNTDIIDGSDDIDGGVIFDNGHHPAVYISPNGLGTSAGHGVSAYDGSGAQGDDGIIYRYEEGIGVVPDDASGNFLHAYDYELLSMDAFWDRRYDIGDNSPFGAFGQLRGDNYGENKAKMPWAWDDPDDGPAMLSVNWSDPAHFVDVHFDGLGDFSHTYLYNPYYSHIITVEYVTSLSNEDAFNDESDLYVYVTVDGEKEIDARFWKYEQAAIGVPQAVWFGKDDAEFGDHFSEDYHTLYVCLDRNTEVVIEVRDADALGTYNSMGTISAAPAPGQTASFANQVTSNGKAAVTASITAK